ncbi:MAG: hypothetical protein ABIW76_22525 [Fibrobacteria bacterium]
MCTSPVLIVLQFLTFIMLMDKGLPYYFRKDVVHSSLLLVGFFALSMPAVPAILLGVRQLFLENGKVVPAIGVALNLAYLTGFAGFFVLIFLTQSLS